MAVNANDDDDLKAEINITPLVDVVLVLLVIFMVVTPLLKQEVPLELPIAEHSRPSSDVEQVTLMLAADGRTLINGTEVPAVELVARLQEMYAQRADKAIFLEADRSLAHGTVVDLMDDCREAGIERIGIVTKPAPPGADPTPAVPAPPAG